MADLIVFESETYYKMMSEVLKAMKKLIEEGNNEGNHENSKIDWITLAEAQKLLPYKSKTTWQKFRDTGTILFTQNGRNILYSRKSIIEFLDKNKVNF